MSFSLQIKKKIITAFLFFFFFPDGLKDSDFLNYTNDSMTSLLNAPSIGGKETLSHS